MRRGQFDIALGGAMLVDTEGSLGGGTIEQDIANENQNNQRSGRQVCRPS